MKKNDKSTNKVHPRLYKLKRKRQNNVLHLNSIRKKNTLPINKLTLDVYYYRGKLYYNNNNNNIRANSRFYSAKHEGFLSTPEIY